MMNSMIKENGVTFKQLEKNIYAWVCQIGREFPKEFLERYDRMLMEDRGGRKKAFCISAERNTGSGSRGFDLNEYGGTVGKRDYRTILQRMCPSGQ